MDKIILNVSPELHKALQERREKTGCPTSTFIRRTLVKVLGAEKSEVDVTDVAVEG